MRSRVPRWVRTVPGGGGGCGFFSVFGGVGLGGVEAVRAALLLRVVRLKVISISVVPCAQSTAK